MKFTNKNVLVYGLSISGEWAVKLLNKKHCNVFVYDDDIKILFNNKLTNCYVLQSVNEDVVSQFDFIVVSPSIAKDNIVLQYAKKHNVKIYSELEFAALFCKNLVAITGTNGKTTTVELIQAILATKYKAVACGNIGYPLSQAIIKNKHSIKVVEVSSFMLEHAQTFHPHVATILNIEPDHLTRHKTLTEYTAIKNNIFKNLTLKDYAVVNLDLNIHPITNCLKLTYSYNHRADVYVLNGYIYLHQDRICAINQLQLKGKHNIYNIMCAICFAYIYKIPVKNIRKAILSFVPDKFRIQHVATIKNISYINDSKSTNIASTLACVETIKGSIILLLGGADKNLNYNLLFAKLSKRVKLVIVYGDVADEIVMLSSNYNFNVEKCVTLQQAFNVAVSNAMPGDNVLLSPATSSYDQFKNYIQRGVAFNEMVKEYEDKITQK